MILTWILFIFTIDIYLIIKAFCLHNKKTIFYKNWKTLTVIDNDDDLDSQKLVLKDYLKFSVPGAIDFEDEDGFVYDENKKYFIELELNKLLMNNGEPNKVIILKKENVSESNYDFLRSIVPADMSMAYEKKFKKRFIVSSIVLGIITIGLIAMLLMTVL